MKGGGHNKKFNRIHPNQNLNRVQDEVERNIENQMYNVKETIVFFKGKRRCSDAHARKTSGKI